MIRQFMNRHEPEPIGVRLRRLRLERGLSQRELAGPGVSYAYISRIEAGTRRPSVKALRMLARSLGVSPEYLETGSELRDVDERELRLADAELQLRIGGEPDAANEAFAVLFREANEAGDTTSAIRAEIGLGLVAAQTNRVAQAAEHLQSAVDAGVSPLDRPDAFAVLARSYSLSGSHERAIELLEGCLDELDRNDPGNVATYVRFAGYLSAALTDQGNLGRAESVLREALGKSENGDSYSRVRLYWAAARLAEVDGHPMRALDYARRAVALLEATEDTHHLARAHLLCAWIMGLEGKSEDAVPHLEKAETLFGPSPDPVDLAQLRVEQAKVAVHKGDGATAVARALDAIDTLGDTYEAEQGSAWWALAEGQALQGNVSEADGAFSRAIDALDAGSRFREAAQSCRRWAKVLRDAGRDAEALDALERATDYAVRSQPATHTPLER
jgi:transcriptional regulator with XRE-family HTH domain